VSLPAPTPEPVVKVFETALPVVGLLTDEEYHYILREVTERAKDIFCERYMMVMPPLVSKDFLEKVALKDIITIEYNVEIDGTSILQMAGRIRRTKEEMR